MLFCAVLLLCSCEEEISRSVELVKLPNGSIVYSIRGYFTSEEFEFRSTNDTIKSKKLIFRNIFNFNSCSILLKCRDGEIVIHYPTDIENDYIAYYNVINGRPRHDTVRADKEYLPKILTDSVDGMRIKVKNDFKENIHRVAWVSSSGFEHLEKNYKMFDSAKGLVFRDDYILLSSDSLNVDKPIQCY
jgi:hypothetical protein